jgi:hypothetical protein
MNHVNHPTINDSLGAPPGWDHQALPCGALPIRRGIDRGMRTVTSFWQPTPDELALLNAGGVVALTVLGVTMPPVMLGVEAP